MTERILPTLLLLTAACPALAQQVADVNYAPPLARPTYEQANAPRVAIDEAHNNFHTADGRYRPFAELLRRDGYRVAGITTPFSEETLIDVDVLVIANPLHARNIGDWSLPTPSAFGTDEIAAVREWVERGGSLLLVADHMPFPGAAAELARSFGVTFSNGYAEAGHWTPREPNTFTPATGLQDNAVTRGRSDEERVTSIQTFAGSAFKLPVGAIPLLVFGEGSVSYETTRAPGITPDAPEVPIQGWSQAALLQPGEGRVAIFGEAAMFSAQLAGPQQVPVGMNAPTASQNHRLLLNVMHWLSRAPAVPD